MMYPDSDVQTFFSDLEETMCSAVRSGTHVCLPVCVSELFMCPGPTHFTKLYSALLFTLRSKGFLCNVLFCSMLVKWINKWIGKRIFLPSNEPWLSIWKTHIKLEYKYTRDQEKKISVVLLTPCEINFQAKKLYYVCRGQPHNSKMLISPII